MPNPKTYTKVSNSAYYGYEEKSTSLKESIDRLGLEIPMRDIQAEPGARDELIAIGGKGQVPCLVIDGKPLYESAEIVRWLEENSG